VPERINPGLVGAQTATPLTRQLETSAMALGNIGKLGFQNSSNLHMMHMERVHIQLYSVSTTFTI
jgi:hypothetical protein